MLGYALLEYLWGAYTATMSPMISEETLETRWRPSQIKIATNKDTFEVCVRNSELLCLRFCLGLFLFCLPTQISGLYLWISSQPATDIVFCSAVPGL